MADPISSNEWVAKKRLRFDAQEVWRRGDTEALFNEIERLQREVNELELTHRVKDNKDLAARDLAELRPCYSVTGLETFIAKHFPALELRECTAQPPLSLPALVDQYVRHLNPGRPPGGIVETVLNGFVKWTESTGTTKSEGQS